MSRGNLGSAPIKLWNNKREQEILENKADLYAIIKTTEKLERAYVKDLISPDAYEKACWRLIAQFKVLWGSLQAVQVPDVEQFMSEYNMICPLASGRLLHSGVPATVAHRTEPVTTPDPQAACVAESVEGFITAMDSLRLSMRAVDQICPVLIALINSMDKIRSLPPNFGPREKMREWYSKLYQKSATYEIDEAEARQMLYDLESSYSTFIALLKRG
mmetsp:Transcript_1357/g.2164  ORF Transcript_1357/g.2164 Transcript_1357/m.2164 type:complete len:217 (+) Transcript_1357:103-753(+)